MGWCWLDTGTFSKLSFQQWSVTVSVSVCSAVSCADVLCCIPDHRTSSFIPGTDWCISNMWFVQNCHKCVQNSWKLLMAYIKCWDVKQRPIICLYIECVQAAHIARLEHLSDAVVCLESFVGTPMESDSTFKAYNGTSSFCYEQFLLCYLLPVLLTTCSLQLLIKNIVSTPCPEKKVPLDFSP